MNPYQPGEDNQDPYEVGYKAGAASRDAEVVSLTNQRDYEYVLAENAEQERDQLRKQVLLLREVMNRIAFSRVGTCENIALELFNREAWAIEALAATEQKP